MFSSLLLPVAEIGCWLSFAVLFLLPIPRTEDLGIALAFFLVGGLLLTGSRLLLKKEINV